MSDEKNAETEKKSKFTLDSDEFIRFLEFKTPESICPACGHDEWTVICPSGENTNNFRLVTLMRDGPKPIHLNTFAIFCKNCGFIRQHLSRFVREWAEENPVEGELDFGDADAEDPTHGA